MKIKKGDRVLVIKGKDKGKAGIVTFVDTKKNRVQIEGLNIQKRHIRKGNTANKPGGIIEVSATMAAANVMYVGEGNIPTRLGYKVTDGKKMRVAKVSSVTIQDVKK